MNELEVLRSKIDQLDTRLVALIKERFSIVKAIGEYKKLNDLPILDPKREAHVLASKKALVDESEWPLYERVFQLLMDLSKELEK